MPRAPAPGRIEAPGPLPKAEESRRLAPGVGSRINVLLGPTNTGKTHRAIERMLEHPTGMIGLPLRLLAREVYDRLTARVGERSVALITGEEKRVGRQARYFVCTVEAMPLDREVDFLAVDEIQLAEHPERGHVFTDRLLHARGRTETWFMGSETMRSMVELLLPTATVEHRPRLSTLSGKGQTSLGGLPTRSAVVAFSVPEVYRLAEALRRRRGGAAIVLGALSPRARNAQVALYEAKEVDYLVATDAIGMGLNLAIRHVAFASLRKFDGKLERPLSAPELAQIAGRAGRHLENGTFGTLSPLPPLHPGLVAALEQHRFERVRRVIWRNSDLDTRSLGALLDSLRVTPTRTCLRRVSESTDLQALERLKADPDVRKRASGARAVELLWEACQIPDYDQGLAEQHASLIKRVFLQLTGPKEKLDPDWLERCLSPLDDADGDLDTLTWRIAALRTWTYLSNQAAWVEDVERFRGQAKSIEDKLSDALHERLVERFVERRRSAVDFSAVANSRNAQAEAQSHNGFAALIDLRARLLGAQEAPSLDVWVEQLVSAPHEHFELDEHGCLHADGRNLARLVRGAGLLHPEIKLTLDGVSDGQRLRLSRRLLAWTRDLVDELLGPLRAIAPDALGAAGRGLSYQLEQRLGTLPAREARQQLATLSNLERRALARADVHLGRDVVYLESSLGGRNLLARLALCRAYSAEQSPALHVPRGAASFARSRGIDDALYASLGFPTFGPRAVRADVARRITRRLAEASAGRRAFVLPDVLADWLQTELDELPAIVRAFGYSRAPSGRYHRRSRARSKPKPRGAEQLGAAANAGEPREH